MPPGQPTAGQVAGPLTGQPAGPAAGRDAGGRPPDQLPRIKEMVMELAPHMHLCLEDLQVDRHAWIVSRWQLVCAFVLHM